jgi:hypothetical protein
MESTEATLKMAKGAKYVEDAEVKETTARH